MNTTQEVNVDTETETEEITAAKDIVWDILDIHHHEGELTDVPDNADFIAIADQIVEALLKAGIYIPQDIQRPDGFYEVKTK